MLEAPLWQAPVLPENTRLGRKWPALANTLAYYYKHKTVLLYGPLEKDRVGINKNTYGHYLTWGPVV